MNLIINIRRKTMKYKLFCFIFFIGLNLFLNQTFAQKTNSTKKTLVFQKTPDKPMATLVNINNITLWANANGELADSPYPDNRPGCIYPRGTAGIVWADGVLWGGLVHDGKEVEYRGRKYLVRVGGSRYSSSLQPGRIITKGMAESPHDPDVVRIWRIRRDWQTADLRQDATEFFNISGDTVRNYSYSSLDSLIVSIEIDSLTSQHVDSVRAQYKNDWNEWPWQKGAPFYDDNGNTIMDEGEEPGLASADQVVWFVANDLDASATEYPFYSPPIGIEMQVTLWAYNRRSIETDDVLSNLHNALQNVIFKRTRIIYKGCATTPDTARIDSMYIAQWSDSDIGFWLDDLVGCDTLLDLGFCYNGYQDDTEYLKYDLRPPAVGYCILSGPIVPSQGDQAFFRMKIKKNFKNLKMTSFAWSVNLPLDLIYDYGTMTCEVYKNLKGFQANNGCSKSHEYYPFPPGFRPGPFPLSGDPVKRTGFIDGLVEYSFPPADRRLLCSSGPFTMALGDTQEVIIALVGGIGADRLSSISVMKHNTRWIRSWMPYIFKMGFQEEELPVVEKEPIPDSFRLFQNYPNPFNAKTEIRYDLPIQRKVKLTIYNLLGEEVNVLVNEIQDAGSYSIKWDGNDTHGNKVPTGIYLYILEAGYWKLSKKMMLLQ